MDFLRQLVAEPKSAVPVEPVEPAEPVVPETADPEPVDSEDGDYECDKCGGHVEMCDCSETDFLLRNRL